MEDNYETTRRWCCDEGASRFEKKVRQSGHPGYCFDEKGKRAIITITRINDPEDIRGVENAIMAEAERFGAEHEARMNSNRLYNKQRRGVNLPPMMRPQLREMGRMREVQIGGDDAGSATLKNEICQRV